MARPLTEEWFMEKAIGTSGRCDACGAPEAAEHRRCWLQLLYRIVRPRTWPINQPKVLCPYCGSLHHRDPARDTTLGDCWLMQRPITGIEIYRGARNGG